MAADLLLIGGEKQVYKEQRSRLDALDPILPADWRRRNRRRALSSG